MRGDELKKFEIWLSQSPNQPTPPTQLQTQYLLLCRQEATRAQRRNQGISIAVAAVLLAVAIFAFLQRNAAVRENRMNTAGRLGTTALSLKDTELDVAFLLSLEGARIEDTFDTRNAALTLFQSSPDLLAYLHSAGPQDGFVNAIVFSPDGRRFATGTDNGTLQMWDTETRQALWIQPRDKGYVERLAFTPDGSTLHVIFLDGLLQDWQVTGHKPVLLAQNNYPEQPTDLAYNSDGTLFALNGQGTGIWSLTADDPQYLRTFSNSVWRIAFSPANPALLASVDGRGAVRLQDASTGQSIVQLPPQNPDEEGLHSIAFSHDGTLLAAAGRGQVSLWQVNVRQAGAPGNGEPLTLRHLLPLGDRGIVMDLAFSPDSRSLAAVSSHGTMRQWDVSSFEVKLDSARSLSGDVHSVAFSPDGRLLLSGLDNGIVLVWDQTHAPRLSVAQSTSVPSNPPGKLYPIRIVAFSPDSRLLAARDLYGGVYLWDIASRHLKRQILAPGSSVDLRNSDFRSFAFTPDSRELLSSVEGREGIQHWTIEPTGSVIPAATIASSRLLARLDPDGIRLVDSAREGPAGQNELLMDGRYLGAGGEPSRLFDLVEHIAKKIQGAAFSIDGKRLALAIYGGVVQLVDVTSLRPLGTPLQSDFEMYSYDPSGVAFSPDGKLLAYGSDQGTVVLWDADPKSWAARACRVANRNLSLAEWHRYLGDATPYRRTCPDLPDGEGVSGK